jgi:hypothetical protein
VRRWKCWIDLELRKARSDDAPADWGKLAGLPIGRGAPPRKQLDRTFAAVVDILRQHPNAEARKGAAYVLAFWGERRTVRPLLAALENESEDAHVRAMAAEGIGYALQYDPHPLKARAVAALRSALSSSSADIRFFSVFALGTVKAEEARGDVEALVNDPAVFSPGWWTVGEEARDALLVLDGGGWPERDSFETTPPATETSPTCDIRDVGVLLLAGSYVFRGRTSPNGCST